MAPRETVARGSAIRSVIPQYMGRAWIAIAVVAAVNWLWAERVGYDFTGFIPVGAAVIVLAAIGCFYGLTGRDGKLAELGNYCAIWIAFPVAVNLYSYVIATLRLPLQDATFAQMDAALGFHWLVWTARIAPHPLAWSAMGYAYNSIFAQVFVSVVYFSFSGHTDRNRELLWTSMLAALVTVTLSGLLPAYGPYTNGQMPEWSAVLQTIREGHVTNFRIADMKGIVAFPSFHTVLGVLLVYAHRYSIRRTSLPGRRHRGRGGCGRFHRNRTSSDGPARSLARGTSSTAYGVAHDRGSLRCHAIRYLRSRDGRWYWLSHSRRLTTSPIRISGYTS
jgi:hypothetical protein